MKLVIDSNRIIAVLIRDSANRKILLSGVFEFFTPEHLVDEIAKYQDYIIQKAHLTPKSFSLLYSQLFDSINVIPLAIFQNELPIASELMSQIDPNDQWFVAVGITLNLDGIWTEDTHFQQQTMLPAFSTGDLLPFLER